MLRLRKLFLVKVVVLLLSFVTACADNSNDTPDSNQNETASENTQAKFDTERLDLMAADAALFITEHPDTIVLDIRTPKEYAQGHIKNALLMNYYEDDFTTRLAALDREKTYVVHCRSGGRSGKAVPMMEELGFKRVIHLAGGFKDWQASNLAVVKD